MITLQAEGGSRPAGRFLDEIADGAPPANPRYRPRTTWAENYYGYILRPHLIYAARAGDDHGRPVSDIKRSVFLGVDWVGPLDWVGLHGHYQDHSSGDVSHFDEREVIVVSGVQAYALD